MASEAKGAAAGKTRCVENDANLERLVARVRTLEAEGAADDEIAAWLNDRTVGFGESLSVLALAQGLERRAAADRLRATATWQRTITRFRIVEPRDVVRGELESINGRTYSVGDVLKLPGGPCRVLSVDPTEDRRLTAQLLIEAGWEKPPGHRLCCP